MSYFAGLHKPSSCRIAARANFLSSDAPALIVAKTTRAEIYKFAQGGIALVSSFNAFGRITAILSYRPPTSRTDHLFVATDRCDFFTVCWDATEQRVKNCRTAVNIHDDFLRDSHVGHKAIFDPGGRMFGLHVYEGSFTAIPVYPKKEKQKYVTAAIPNAGDLGKPVLVKLDAPKVEDLCFLYTEEKLPVLAIYTRDPRTQNAALTTYTVDAAHEPGVLKNWIIEDSMVDTNISFLIPINKPVGGLLAVTDHSVIVYSTHHKGARLKRPLPEVSTWEAWAVIDCQRYLLADDLGGLHMLFLTVNDEMNVHDMEIKKIGKTSVATSLIYLEQGYVFVGSHYGDSQIIHLSDDGLQLVQAFDNLAPVLDFQVLELGDSGGGEQQSQYTPGHARIVSGSGGFVDGSLRSVVNGVGLEDAAILVDDITGLRAIFSLKSIPDYEHHDIILLSFDCETRAFKFDEQGEAEEVEHACSGLDLDTETLVASNLPGGRILQVTRTGGRILEAEGGMEICTFDAPGGSVSSAAAHDTALIICCGGKNLIVYNLRSEFAIIGEHRFGSEVSALYISNTLPELVVVGLWSHEVVFLSVDGLQTQLVESLGTNSDLSVPRSLMLAKLQPEQPPTLLVAMSDGLLYTFSFNPGTHTLSNRKTIALATQAVYFTSLPHTSGTESIFASSEHPSLIYGDPSFGTRISYSTITSDKISNIAAFHALAYPDSVVILQSGALKIASVDKMRQIHCKSMHMGKVVRRLAVDKKNKLFALGTLSQSVDEASGDETLTSYVEIVDDATFRPVEGAILELEPKELIETIICSKLDSGDGTKTERFLVGTSITDDEQDAPHGGRVIVVELTPERTLKVLGEQRLKAPVKCLAMAEDGAKLVVALQQSVAVFTVHPLRFGKPKVPAEPIRTMLTQLYSYRCHSEPIDLSVISTLKGDNWTTLICVADLLQGPIVLRLGLTKTAGIQLEECARSFLRCWSTAVAWVDSETVIAGDLDGNVCVWRLNDSVLAENQKKLVLIGSCHLGEVVNKIRTVIPPPLHLLPDSAITPQAFLGTVDGGIYIFASILSGKASSPHLSSAHTNTEILCQLQMNLAEVVKGVGETSFLSWRSATNSDVEGSENGVKGPYRIVDGDYLEGFLELSEKAQEVVLKQPDDVGVDVEGARGVVEGLRRAI